MAQREQVASSQVARRSDRVEISISIDAIGTDYHRGRPFCQRGQTLTVSRHGAAIALNYALATDQELTIRCVNTAKEAVARVVGLVSGPGKDLVYGIAFLDAAANPWAIEFPALAGSDDVLGRVLLTCRLCQTYSVVHLNEIELQVFETNGSIQQFCKLCSVTTSWKRAANETAKEINLPKDTQTNKSGSQASHKANRRKHGRVRTNVAACIRQSGFAEEVVTCENLSRGGLRLRTSRAYQEGARIEVALPYSTESGNIFVPAQVIHAQDCGGFFRLGVAYTRVSGEQPTSVYSGSTSVADRTRRRT